jgi:3-oxoacyl-[acyl-carrier-protein] synthase-3
MAQVAQRTGVLRRHFAAPNETALDLSHQACRLLLEETGTNPDRVEALIVCTQTPDFIMPPNACLLQDRLGLAKNVAAFDLTLACSGYVYGLFLAKALIESGALETVILVTADTYSRLISADDRGPYALFGDGAAATLLVAGEVGLGEFVLGTDGSRGSAFAVPAGGARNPRSESTSRVSADRNGNLRSQEHIQMDGPAILAFVQREVPGAVDCLLKKAGATLSEVDLVLFHQASQVALDYLEEVLGIPPAKTFRNLERVGNTVSASLPVLLSDAQHAGRLKPGDLVLLVGFGVGLSWGACLLEW